MRLASVLLVLISAAIQLSSESVTVPCGQNEEINLRLETLEAKVEQLQKDLDGNCIDPRIPRNCKEVQDRGYNVTGNYYIQPRGALAPFLVWCDLDTRGGGWTRILSRSDSSEDFSPDWKKYKDGFGNPGGQFWLGLDNIHYLTGYEVNELLVILKLWISGKRIRAVYSSFSVGNEREHYKLKLIDGYSGNAGDRMGGLTDVHFAIKYIGSCITFNETNYFNGAWWYDPDHYRGHLTGEYPLESLGVFNCSWTMSWGHQSLREAIMMVRPRNY